MYEKILMPVEGDGHSSEILEHAVEHARNHNSELHVVHVMEGGKMSEMRAKTDTSHPDGPHADKVEANRVLPDVQEEVPDDIEAFYVEPGGDVVDEIREYVDENDIDLIVMGTHGRSGVRRFIMGSVAEEVVRNSGCPVMTVPLDV